MTEPVYLELLTTNGIKERVAMAQRCLEHCDLCPRNCGVNRNAGEVGFCKIGKLARITSYGPHMGEEDALKGWAGSGTIFFSGCNLSCQFCQNFDISQFAKGKEIHSEEIADIMLNLQNRGCHNINLVSPTHVIAQILSAIMIAAQNGLRLPIVYNSGGYDQLSTLKLLDSVADIYLPDMKYSDASLAKRFSGVSDYPTINQAAVLEMHRQVGDLQINASGLAVHGLLVRHLVLPGGVARTQEVVMFLAGKVSAHTYINIMSQYHPAYHANRYPVLNRRITPEEYNSAIQSAIDAGLYRLESHQNLP